MKRTFLTVIVFIAAAAFLALALADREIQAGIRRLSNYRFPPRSALDADPGPRLAANRGDLAIAERRQAKPASLSPDHDGLP